MSWEEVKLTELVSKIGSGVTPKGGESVYIQSGTSLIRSQNVYNSYFTDNGLVYIDDTTSEKMKNVTVNENDVLLNITGDSVARCCLAPLDFLPARVNQHVAIIRPDSKLDSKFLMNYIISPNTQKYLLAIASGAGATRKALTKGLIENLVIQTPPLETQKRIASILSAYDDLIENNNKRIKILEEMAQNIYKEWFVNFRFPNYENTEFDKETGLPVGWEVVKFENLYSLNNGYAFKSEDYSEKGVNILRTRDYSSSFFINMESPICIPEEKAVNFSKYLIKEFDFLIIMVGASIGKTGLVLSKDTPSLLNQNQWAIRALESFHNYNIYKIFNAQTIISELLMKRTGAARDFFRASFLKEIKVLKPKNDLINEFNSKIIPILKKISLLQEQNQKLKEARDILLPRLMNRTIEV